MSCGVLVMQVSGRYTRRENSEVEKPKMKQVRVGASLPILAILLVVITFITYIPALRGGFIWDDDTLITENPIIKASDGLRRLWLTTDAPDYYPLTGSLWWLEWRIWGDNATGYHVVNVLLHSANAMLVWMILRRLKIPGAWLAGLVFAIHPVNVATTAWISEQKNTLSMLFFAMSILLYLKFDEKDQWRWYSLSLLAFLLALLSKSAVVMLPFVLLECVWWLHGRVRWKDWLCSVPFFVSSLVFGLVTIWFQYHQVLQGSLVRSDSFFARVAGAGWVPWFYLYKAFLPLNLTVIYPKWQIDASRWVSYVPGALLVVCFLVLWRKRKTWGRPLLFSLGYFAVMLFPVLGFFDQALYRYSSVADHWQYYSIAGVIALAVAAGDQMYRRLGNQPRRWGIVAAVLMLTVLGAASWQRAGVYAADERLWRDNVAKNPTAWMAYSNLGLNMEWAGNPDAAVGYFEQALRINPDSADAHNNLALALLQLGRTPEAVPHLEQAVRLNPHYADAHVNLGNALFQLGKVPEAFSHYQQALRLDPNSPLLHDDLGVALEKLDRVAEAIEQYEMALRINPDFAEAHNDLGNAFERQGKVREAREQYEQALGLNPDLTAARNALARLRATQ
jgi:tetratricopeptide (TPR) repeat protein